MNNHEEARRQTKALHLLHVLEVAGVTAAEAEAMADDLWERATSKASETFGVNHDLPSPATKAMVVALLEDRERLAGSDPLAGLPSADGFHPVTA